MLQITIPAVEWWDERKQEFVYSKTQVLQLEHSLVSLSKWESKWNKPFLSKGRKSYEETVDYIKCMTLTQNVDPIVYNNLTDENLNQVNKYIESPMTATWFRKEAPSVLNNEQITSELIYYWMVALNVPFECQKWHINRLFTLIKICNIKNQPKKKRSGKDIARSYAAINASRRKEFNTRG